MVKDLELFSFELSLRQAAPRPDVICPCCGYQIYKSVSIFTRGNLSKSLAIFCCGTIIYLNFFKKDLFRSFLLNTKDQLQYYTNSIITFFTRNGPTDSSIIYQYFNNSSNNVSNQIIVNNQDEESNDFSSITFSPLNSIGLSTVAKFDYLLDQVQHIKDNMNDSYSQLDCYHPQISPIFDRRPSEGELTLPSLEWDLGDIEAYNESIDSFVEDSHRKELFMKNIKHNDVIDAEMLAQIILNKNFHLKEEKIFNVRKQYTFLKHQLKFLSKNYHQQHNHHHHQSNLNSASYRSNRDSAYFEE